MSLFQVLDLVGQLFVVFGSYLNLGCYFVGYFGYFGHSVGFVVAVEVVAAGFVEQFVVVEVVAVFHLVIRFSNKFDKIGIGVEFGYKSDFPGLKTVF